MIKINVIIVLVCLCLSGCQWFKHEPLPNWMSVNNVHHEVQTVATITIP